MANSPPRSQRTIQFLCSLLAAIEVCACCLEQLQISAQLTSNQAHGEITGSKGPVRIGGWQDKAGMGQSQAVSAWTPRRAIKGGGCSGLEAAQVASPEVGGQHAGLTALSKSETKLFNQATQKPSDGAYLIFLTPRCLGLTFQVHASAPFKPGKSQKIHLFTPPSIFIVPISNRGIRVIKPVLLLTVSQ